MKKNPSICLRSFRLRLRLPTAATALFTCWALLPGAVNLAAADYALIVKTLANPFWVAVSDGAKQEAKLKGVKVDIFAASNEEDIQGQQRLLEDVINKGYKVIGVAPITSVSLIQAIVKANKKGIYVVNIGEQIDPGELKAAGGSVVAFLSTDDRAVGEKAAKFLMTKIGTDGGDVAIIEGKAGNSSGDARRDGAADAFKVARNFRLVASLPADWDRARALDVATNILQRNPGLKAIYAANDTMALGAYQAVRNANKQGRILVVGTDGAPEALDSVSRDELNATVAQDSAALGAIGLDVMIETLNTKPPMNPALSPRRIAIESRLVTKAK